MERQKILITLPSFNVHGGIRVILEWANRLAARHEVLLYLLRGSPRCDWFDLDSRVRIVRNDRELSDSNGTHRTFVFLQMMEHLFQPNNPGWQKMCLRTYTTKHPIITISRWGERMMRKQFRRKEEVHYVGNGVNLDHFPIDHTPKDGRTVLVEGWIPTNATKDTARLGPRVAQRLKQMGFKVLAYSAEPLSGDYASVPDVYYQKPTLAQLNQLYKEATILIKASHVDFRSCAPMEAMTKGTVTARAIVQGDDDLSHHINCLRSPYTFEGLLQITMELAYNKVLRENLAKSCYSYVQSYTWDYWIWEVEKILFGSAYSLPHRPSDNRVLNTALEK